MELLDFQEFHQMLSEGGHELGALIGEDILWNSKPCEGGA